jgi:hypothetical protein
MSVVASDTMRKNARSGDFRLNSFGRRVMICNNSKLRAIMATVGIALGLCNAHSALADGDKSEGAMAKPFKLAVLLTRNPDLPAESFSPSWLRARGGEAATPGLIRHVYNSVPPNREMKIRTGAAYGFDGIEELWFTDRPAAEAYLAALPDRLSEANAPVALIDPTATVVVGGQCHVIVESPPRQPDASVKLLILNRRRAGMTSAEFGDYWINHHGRLVQAAPGAEDRHRRIEYCPLEPLGGSSFAGVAFDGIATIQFNSPDDLAAALDTEYYRTVLATDEPLFSEPEESYGTPVRESVFDFRAAPQ